MIETTTLDTAGWIVRTPGTLGGRARIAGRRIGVDHVAAWLVAGETVETIARDYDLPVEAVEAARAWWLREVDAREVNTTAAE